MALIHIITWSIILIPLFSPQKNKYIGCVVSFLILFVIFGLQYEMTQDWDVYVSRWNSALLNDMEAFHGSETVYKGIMSFLHPIGFFGFLIIWAIFVLCTFYFFLKEYVGFQRAWMFFAIFMLYVFHFAYTYIDTNRQTLAICFCMWGMYMIQVPMYSRKSKFKWYILGFLLFYCALKTHSSSIIALPLLFFPYVSKKITNLNFRYLYILVFVNLLSNIIDFSAVGNLLGTYMNANDSMSAFSVYSEEVLGRDRSIPEQLIYLLLQIFMIESFLKYDEKVKPLVLASIVYYALQGYATATMARAFFYYEVFTLYTIPISFNIKIENAFVINFRKVFIAYFFAYLIFSYNKNMVESHYMLERWFHFKTLLNATTWQ